MKGSAKRSQRGIAILAITVILLLVATLATLLAGRVGQMEQQSVGTDVRKKEVYSAAVGGMEYALDWYGANWNSAGLWSDTNGDGVYGPGDQASPAPLAESVLGTDRYAHTLTYTLLTELYPADNTPVIIEVTSTATGGGDLGNGDTHVSKTITQHIMRGERDPFGDPSSGGPGVLDAPPVVVENCMGSGAPGATASDKVTGNPEIFPASPGGIVIGTTSGSTGCVDSGAFDLHGGVIEALPMPTSLWSTIFGSGVTEADLYKLESRFPERVYIVDDTTPNHPAAQSYSLNGGVNGNWHTDLNDPSIEPYLLYFEESVGCPKINGSRTVHGLVYYEASNCSSHGFGGGEIRGTIAVSGSMMKHSANTTIIGTALDFNNNDGVVENGTDNPGFYIEAIAEIPGSWRDY